MEIMQIAIAQINPIAGDLTYNSSKIEEYIKKAKEDKVELIIFSTGALIGLNIKNLYLDKTFAEETKRVTNKILELIYPRVSCVSFSIFTSLRFKNAIGSKIKPIK